MSELEKQYAGKVRIIRIDVGNPASAQAIKTYRIRGTPGFVLFDRTGKVAAQVQGWPGREQIAKAFDQLIARN